MARAVTAAAYDAGAHQVEVHYADPHVQLARLEHAPDEALGSVIPWVRERPEQLAEMKGSLIQFSGPVGARAARSRRSGANRARHRADRRVDPGDLRSGRQLDDRARPERAMGEARAPRSRRGRRRWRVCGSRSLTSAGSTRTIPSPPGGLGRASSPMPRSVSRTPSSTRCASSDRAPTSSVGLLPDVRWNGGQFETAWGREHIPNIPTEEVFTSPDPGAPRAT